MTRQLQLHDSLGVCGSHLWPTHIWHSFAAQLYRISTTVWKFTGSGSVGIVWRGYRNNGTRNRHAKLWFLLKLGHFSLEIIPATQDRCVYINLRSNGVYWLTATGFMGNTNLFFSISIFVVLLFSFSKFGGGKGPFISMHHGGTLASRLSLVRQETTKMLNLSFTESQPSVHLKKLWYVLALVWYGQLQHHFQGWF